MWQIGHHDGCILTAFVHLVQVDKDFGIALIKMDALWEEHRCIAMGVKGQHAVVYLMGMVIGQSLLDEPMEQGHTLLETLRMPLHTDNGLILVALHRLDDIVR